MLNLTKKPVDKPENATPIIAVGNANGSDRPKPKRAMGIEEGIEEGIAVGIEVGIEVGIAAGIAAGIVVGIAVGIAARIAVGIATWLGKHNVKEISTSHNLISLHYELSCFLFFRVTYSLIFLLQQVKGTADSS